MQVQLQRLLSRFITHIIVGLIYFVSFFARAHLRIRHVTYLATTRFDMINRTCRRSKAGNEDTLSPDAISNVAQQKPVN